MYRVIQTKKFKKALKKILKSGFKREIVNEIDEPILILQKGESLPIKYRDHKLSGNFTGHRKFHVRPDLLIVYKIEKEVLILTLVEIGSHSYLF